MELCLSHKGASVKITVDGSFLSLAQVEKVKKGLGCGVYLANAIDTKGNKYFLTECIDHTYHVMSEKEFKKESGKI